MARAFRAFTVALAAAALVSPSARSTGDATPASVSFVRGQSIFVGSSDGRVVSRVLRGSSSAEYYDPAWSTTGRLAVAVARTSGPDEELGWGEVVVGRPPGRLVAVRGGDAEPSWAPDGRRLVLVADQADGGGLNIWEAASNRASELTPEYLEGPTFDSAPAWSPDGSRIAFARRENGRTTLYVILPDGRGLRQVTRSRAMNPSWSPDGKRLVFDDGRRIAVVNADGRNLRYLTRPAGRDTDPAWSRVGSTIAFVRYRTADSESGDIWRMNPDGSRQRLLVRNGEQPAWK